MRLAVSGSQGQQGSGLFSVDHEGGVSSSPGAASRGSRVSRLLRVRLPGTVGARACGALVLGAVVTLAACGPARAAGSAAAPGAVAESWLLDDFETLEPWEAAPASGVEMRVGAAEGRESGQSMRVDFDFRGGGGWAAARRELPLELPENYELSFWMRAEVPTNTLEIKLIDPSGENVWWIHRPEFDFPGEWQRIAFRQRHVQFAWGPERTDRLRDLGALEFTITAGTGGRGTVWIDDIRLTPLEPVVPYDLTPALAATASAAGSAPALALDGDAGTGWRSGRDGAQRLDVDFLRSREFGGLLIDWEPGERAADYDVQVSRDGQEWETVRSVRGGARVRDYLFMPETEARYVRLDLLRSAEGRGYGVREIHVQPLEWAESRNQLFETVAADALRGDYPKYLSRVQSYWTVFGVEGDATEALINEEGMIETEKRSFSIEPFLHADGQLVAWSDASITQSLEGGYLPIPSVAWSAGDLGLTVTAWADGERGSSTLWARYRVENRSAAARSMTLYLALRPFQVNPSWQFLNNPGGAAPVREIEYDGEAVVVNGDRRVVPVTRPAGFGAAAFDQGNVVDWLREGRLPESRAITDAFGHASGALAYPLELGPGESRDVYLAVPMQAGSPPVAANRTTEEARAVAEPRLAATIGRWQGEVDRFSIELPGEADRIGRTLKSNLAYILINRDGPSIQPGSRSYERSWIRDGSLTSAAMLRLGHPEPVREFIEWFAPFQYEDGKVPCCVDHRGADPVPENDSHGQLIFLIAEYYRYTGDRALLERMWPHVEMAVEYMDSLRHSRMTPEYETPELRAYYGLLPESISHEGYAERPMHSFWDQLFAVKGFKDAAFIAGVLGREADRSRIAAMRDEFRDAVMESYRLTMEMHGIDYLAGAVELGDFDATSTTVALTPAGEKWSLPGDALQRTFERYWDNHSRRVDGSDPWTAYTPYELRVVGTFVRLGDRRRAHELLDWLFEDQRPAAWNHWAEVVFRDPDHPGFIGDMPHTWVGSDFIRSASDMFVYERDEDDAFVVGAGILPEWVTTEPGVVVRGLRTYFGTLGYTMRVEGETVVVDFEGDVEVPSGGLVLRSPLERPIRSATADGQPVRDLDGEEVRLSRMPRRVILRY